MSNTSPSLSLDRLDCYAAALALDALVVDACRGAGRGCAFLTDQAQRASASAVLNIAEAMGRDGGDRAHAFRIARGSAFEVDAAMALLAQRGRVSQSRRQEARALCARVVAMLTRLCGAPRR